MQFLGNLAVCVALHIAQTQTMPLFLRKLLQIMQQKVSARQSGNNIIRRRRAVRNIEQQSVIMKAFRRHPVFGGEIIDTFAFGNTVNIALGIFHP